MANPSNIGGTGMLEIDYGPEMCEATGTSQSITLNPHCTYAVKHNSCTCAAPPVAATEAIFFDFVDAATVSSVSGANSFMLNAGESVSGIGPGKSSINFIGGAASLSFSIWPSATRFGKF